VPGDEPRGLLALEPRKGPSSRQQLSVNCAADQQAVALDNLGSSQLHQGNCNVAKTDLDGPAQEEPGCIYDTRIVLRPSRVSRAAMVCSRSRRPLHFKQRDTGCPRLKSPFWQADQYQEGGRTRQSEYWSCIDGSRGGGVDGGGMQERKDRCRALLSKA
jgi:hypothetical protein